LSAGLLEHFELSFEAGCGQLFRLGRILRRNGEEAGDAEALKEFELLGAQVAVPIWTVMRCSASRFSTVA
jgi:hypothetical protein